MSYKKRDVGNEDDNGSIMDSQGDDMNDGSDNSVSDDNDDYEEENSEQLDSPGQGRNQDVEGDMESDDESGDSEMAAIMEAKAAALEEGLTAKALDFLKAEFRNQRGIFVDKA